VHFASVLLAFVLKLGGFGLLILGILDSSFLFAPWGNDLLVVAMTARNPHVGIMLYYAAMSTVGSVLGCLLIDVTIRPLGAKGLEKHLSARKIKRLEAKVRDRAGTALAIASLVPPPFPFTPFVMAAAAFQYSRRRMVAVIGVSRMLRFALFGFLALRFGKSILYWLRNPVVQGVLIGLTVICIAGSAISVYGWIRRSRPSKSGDKGRKPSLVDAKKTA